VKHSRKHVWLLSIFFRNEVICSQWNAKNINRDSSNVLVNAKECDRIKGLSSWSLEKGQGGHVLLDFEIFSKKRLFS